MEAEVGAAASSTSSSSSSSSSDEAESSYSVSSGCLDAIDKEVTRAAETVAEAMRIDAVQTEGCVDCEGDRYCPSRTTEVFYACAKGFTPERVGLSNVPVNLMLCVLGMAVLSGAVRAVRTSWWRDKHRDS